MVEFLIYLLGWVVYIVGYYLYYMYIVKYKCYTYKHSNKKNKKLIIYDGFKYGIFSWAGVMFWGIVIICGSILYGILSINEWITNKLSNE